MQWLFNVIVFLAGFIVVVAVVIFLQLDCICGTLFGADKESTDEFQFLFVNVALSNM